MRSRGVGGKSAKAVLASVTKYIPHAAIAHAGGQYVWGHYDALRPVMDVREIAPDTPLNRAARDQRANAAEIELLPGEGLLRSGRFKLLGDLDSAWSGSAVPRNIRRAFSRADSAAWSALDAADLIEFQWSEMMALAPLVRRRLPGAPLVGIAHDVITQRWERSASVARFPTSAAYRLAARRSRPRESHSFDALDLLIAFSEKDARLASALAPRTRLEVVLPGLGPAPGEAVRRSPDSSQPVVLFTGALGRPDNSNAVEWFLERVWPAVLEQLPAAQFVAAGAGARSSLQAKIVATPRARLTGFVDSLEPYYAGASVFVAPLLTGAGVKFKTIDALLRGVPTVATPVGAEGIEAAHHFEAITSDAGEFGRAVVRAIRSPDASRIDRAAQWAQAHYGRPAFEQRLRRIYLGLLESSGGRA